MSKKAAIALMAAGAALILSALLLFFHNRQEDARAGEEAGRLLVRVEAAIDARVDRSPSQGEEPADASDSEMPVVYLDGYDYVGCIQFPTLELKLPVFADWDYNRLKIAPCRQFGSSRTDDLVIAAHNYRNHFGRLDRLSKGDPVLLTDMDGAVNAYSVEKTETLAPTAVDAVQNSGCALVLYTCTLDGGTRIAVFCSRVPADGEDG